MKKYKIVVMVLIAVLLALTACGKKKEITLENGNEKESNNEEYNTMFIELGLINDKENVEPYILDTDIREYELQYMCSVHTHNNDIADNYAYVEKSGIDPESIGVIEAYVSNGKIQEIIFDNIDFPFWEQKMVFDNMDEAMIEAGKIAEKYIDINEYVLTKYEKDGNYTFIYERYVDGIVSRERFRIDFGAEEQPFFGIRTMNIGKLENATLGDFDDSKAQEIALNKMKEKYGDYDFEIRQKVVNMVDGNIGVAYTYATADGGLSDVIFVYLK